MPFLASRKDLTMQFVAGKAFTWECPQLTAMLPGHPHRTQPKPLWGAENTPEDGAEGAAEHDALDAGEREEALVEGAGLGDPPQRPVRLALHALGFWGPPASMCLRL